MSKSKVPSLLCPSELVSEEQLATDRRILEFGRAVQQLNRRSFLSVFSAAAAAATFSTLGTRKADAQVSSNIVVNVLNFALNLEYLEANFYLSASGGTLLTGTDAGTAPGAVSGAPGKLNLDANTLSIAQALAADEVHHIETIRSTIAALGGVAISQPAINLAAMGAVTTQAQFLSTARQFTAVGGGAYAGAAQFLVSNPTVLTAAAQILGAEGQHDGTLNYQCVNQGVVSPPVDALDVPPTASNYFTAAPTTSLAPARTTSQDLQIVYAAPGKIGVTKGGFFPNGVNGAITST